MFHGNGHDGNATAWLDDALTNAARFPRGPDDALYNSIDATESSDATVWTPAPGAVVVLPERYTPSYAYPALIWLAGPDDSEHSARDWLAQVSTRNFVAIGLRAELYNGSSERNAAGLDPRHVRRGLSRFESLLRSIDNWVRLHPRRRYVVGSGPAARVAMSWLLTRPEWFAGAVAIDSPPADTAAWHTQSPQLASRRLLWLRSADNIAADLDDAELLALSCLGVEVTTQRTMEALGPAHIGQCINRWVLDAVPSVVHA